MRLLINRSQRQGLRRIYILDVRGHFSDEELGELRLHGLMRRELYGRLEIVERGRGLLGLLFRGMFGGANLTITVRDLVEGKRIECDDLVEALAVEDAVRRAGVFLGQVLDAGTVFDGEEQLEI